MGHSMSKRLSFKSLTFRRSSRQKENTLKFIQEAIKADCIVIFSKTKCPFCAKAKAVFNEMEVDYKAIEIDLRDDSCCVQNHLQVLTGARTVPRVFVNGVCIGGAQEIIELHKTGELLPLVMNCAPRSNKNEKQ